MALAEQVDPASGFRFGLEIEGIVIGWFAQCSGLSIEREVFPYKEGGLNAYVHQLPGRVKSADITLKRGLADQELWRWFREGLYNLKVERHNVSIILYSTDRTEAKRWDLTDAYPVQWTGPDINADDNRVAVETLKIGQGSSTVSAQIQRAEEIDQGDSQSASTIDSDQERSMDEDINVPLLASKVYDLLKQELRWEQERLGRHRW
jgi:phage tail-like protein